MDYTEPLEQDALDRTVTPRPGAMVLVNPRDTGLLASCGDAPATAHVAITRCLGLAVLNLLAEGENAP